MSRLRWPLWVWILAGIVVGIAVGAVLQSAYGDTAVADTALYRACDGIASIFLKLLKMVVIPLVFFSLLSGLLGLRGIAQLGRMGLKTLGLYLITSLLAILTGLILVNTIRPGVGLDLTIPTDPVDKEVPTSFWDVLTSMVPSNPVESAANFDLFGVIFFAILFGGCLLTLTGEKRRTLETFIEAAADVMMKMTQLVIGLAPVGIAALIARVVATTGVAVFAQMGWYVLTVALALGIHLFVTLPLLIALVARRNPYRFLGVMSPALITGFSTASSAGTLGVTMDRIENGAGVSNRVASFVLPIGATVNMDGTALYEIVSVLFIAQLHASIDPTFTLTAAQQVLIVFLGLAVSIGAAGIPHAGLVMMVIILGAVGLPVEYTGLIWAVDRLLDMSRTAVNIASDSTVSLIVATGEGEAGSD